MSKRKYQHPAIRALAADIESLRGGFLAEEKALTLFQQAGAGAWTLPQHTLAEWLGARLRELLWIERSFLDADHVSDVPQAGFRLGSRRACHQYERECREKERYFRRDEVAAALFRCTEAAVQRLRTLAVVRAAGIVPRPFPPMPRGGR